MGTVTGAAVHAVAAGHLQSTLKVTLACSSHSRCVNEIFRL